MSAKDPEISGDSMRTRPGLQALVRGAVAGHYDVVLAVDLNRFSRDMADPAIFFKKMRFARVEIATVSDRGVVGPMHIGIKGTMNAMEREKIVFHTRRGLRGRIAAGRSAGGRSYGYRIVPGPLVRDPKSGHMVPERGHLEIDPQEKATVERIFREYVSGISPKAIQIALNREGVPGPRGGAWSPATIHGHAKLGPESSTTNCTSVGVSGIGNSGTRIRTLTGACRV